MTLTLEWCDPPGPAFRWSDLLAPLMERPGQWAMVRTYDRANDAYQAANYLRGASNGTTRSRVPDGRWVFRSRQVDFDVAEWGVWAKYLGSSTGETSSPQGYAQGCTSSATQAKGGQVHI